MLRSPEFGPEEPEMLVAPLPRVRLSDESSQFKTHWETNHGFRTVNSAGVDVIHPGCFGVVTLAQDKRSGEMLMRKVLSSGRADGRLARRFNKLGV